MAITSMEQILVISTFKPIKSVPGRIYNKMNILNVQNFATLREANGQADIVVVATCSAGRV